ncbi:MAG: YdjY domain-containing protein [Phycisphaerae bacterium]
MLALLGAITSAGATAPKEGAPPPAGDNLAPILLETDEADPLRKAPKEAPPAKAERPPKPIRVDEEARSVRLPVRFSQASGAVEWFLSSGEKHQRMSVFVTDHPAKAVAASLAKAGLPAGTAPLLVGEDRVRPPKGTPVDINVVVTRADGTEIRYPASLFIATSSVGEPAADGQWVYVGPPIAREGEAEILVTALSGSLVTTNLRDSSALVYWVPEKTEGFVRTFYVSGMPLPAEGFSCELEIRPAEEKPAGAGGGM